MKDPFGNKDIHVPIHVCVLLRFLKQFVVKDTRADYVALICNLRVCSVPILKESKLHN